jgi:hypothetical protein
MRWTPQGLKVELSNADAAVRLLSAQREDHAAAAAGGNSRSLFGRAKTRFV